jgi:hypothetical protein
VASTAQETSEAKQTRNQTEKERKREEKKTLHHITKTAEKNEVLGRREPDSALWVQSSLSASNGCLLPWERPSANKNETFLL